MIIPNIDSYTKNYELNFSSLNGNEIRFEIYRRGKYFDPILEDIIADENAVNIEFGSSGDGLFSHIKTKTLSVNIMCQTDGIYNDFINADFYSFYCNLYINNVLEFKGWIIPDTHTEAFTTPPYPIRLKFGCGLFLLKENFQECPFFVGPALTTIREALNFTAFKFNIVDAVQLYEKQQITDNIGDKKKATLQSVYIPTEVFAGLSYFEILESICRTFYSEIFQYKGQWVIRRIDSTDTSISAAYYDQLTGTFQDLTTLTFNNTINGSQTAVNSRICWRDNLQQLEVVPPAKELNVNVPKDLTDNFFITGSDFEGDCEYNNPDDLYPTAASLKFYSVFDLFDGGTLADAYKYFKKYLATNFNVLYLNANGWKYHYADNCKLDIDLSVTGYMQLTERFQNTIYTASTNYFFYAIPGATWVNNMAVVFDTSFGNIEAGQIYYTHSVSVVSLGVSFKVSRQKNAFNPITASAVDVDSFKSLYDAPHVSLQVFLFKNFTSTGTWTLGNDGQWYTLSATSNNKLTVDLYIDVKEEKDITTTLKMIDLKFASIGIIPDDGYLYYKAQGVCVDDVFDMYLGSMKFTIKKYTSPAGTAIITPFDTDLNQTQTILSYSKEIIDYEVPFSDTPGQENPHLIYRNYLTVNDPIAPSQEWSLSTTVLVYKQNYELIFDLIRQQVDKRRAVLRGNIFSKLQLTAHNLIENNYKTNAIFKNIFCNFNPKFETYQGEWLELYRTPQDGGGFDDSFDNSFDN